MPAQITNFQCPACTGPLHFDGSTGKLRCDYCGSTFTVQEIEALYGEKIESAQQAAAAQAVTPEAQNEQAGGEGAPEGWDWNAVSDDWGTAGVNMRAYSCPSCGAELICDATTVATQCPYCGNPTVVLSQFDGNLKPDYILPFKLDKEAAIAALKDFYKDKKLLPRQFAASNQIEKIQGVYVPFWLFNGTVEVDMDFSASRSMTHREGDRIITETDHFRLRRAGDVDFERIPVDGSRRMPDAHMDAIEPFDYRELKPFSPGYLPGFLANKYDVDKEECARRADERAVNTAEQTVKDFVAENMQDGVETSGVDFADLGTTRHINDTLVAKMRKNGAPLFKSGIQYAQAPAGDLFYLRMRYLYQGDTLQNTFYLDSTLTQVVAFK